MASLAAVVDADELLRAIGSTPPASGTPPASSSGGGSGGRPTPKPEPASSPQASGARRMRVEGEVKADAPLRQEPRPENQDNKESAPELPELRGFIRNRRAALAGFMEQGAGLVIDGDVLTVIARNDIYIRYLNDNKAVIAELASEHLGRTIRVELSINGAVKAAAARTTMPLGANGLTRELPAAPASTPNPVAAENGQGQTAPPPKPVAPIKEVAPVKEIALAPTMKDVARRPATPEERQAVLSDPSVRRVFDTLDARLVELRIPSAVQASATEKESK
jgi:hypothetical protein